MKQCVQCLQYKTLDNYSWRNKSKQIKHHICKKCQREASKRHYINNKDLYKERAKQWNEDNSYKREAVMRNSYAKLKGYENCTCCDKDSIDNFLSKCPQGYHVDHIICARKGGKHCLKNLQYLTIAEHCSKSGSGD